MVLITWVKKYIGVSTDEKLTEGVPPGSRFWESDTDTVYVFDGMEWKASATVLF